MIRHFLMAGIVPATFCVANPTAYSEAGCNVAAMGTYARYGIEQSANGFAWDVGVNLNASLTGIHSVSFSSGIYKQFDGWKIGPEFSTGLAAHRFKDSFVYTSYAVRATFDLSEGWAATSSLGFHPTPKEVREHGIRAWPVYSLGLQRKF